MRLLMAGLMLAIMAATSDADPTIPLHASCVKKDCECKEIPNFEHGRSIHECKVNGSTILIQYKTSKFYIRCESLTMDVGNSNMPEMSQQTEVEEIEFYACSAPLNGSYINALKKMKLTVTKNLLLSQFPANPRLEYNHLSGLSINELEITGYHADPPRLMQNYTGDVKELHSLALNNVILEPKAFLQLPLGLETLILRYTQLPAVQITLGNSSWLQRLKSLRTLKVSEESNKLTLPKFESLSNLTTVDLRFVPLDQSNLVGKLNGSAIKHLVMRSCGLNNLPETLFEGANLTTLNLSLNNLTVKADVFSPLQWLTELNLDETQTDRTDFVNIVSSLPKLETLRANENPLSSLCDEENPIKLNWTHTLRHLSLRKSNVTRICPEWMEHKHLVTIDLSGNNIRDLKYNDLKTKSYAVDSTAQVTIDLTKNPNLRIVNVSSGENTSQSSSEDPTSRTRAKVLLKLDKLQCDYNSYLLREVLRTSSWLELEGNIYGSSDELLCPENDLCSGLQGCTCDKRPRDNATVVRCAGALPQTPRWPRGLLALHVAPGTLSHVPRLPLVELHASGNNITNLDTDIPRTLLKLDLSHNNIQHISEAAARKLTANRASLYMYLKGNQLNCNCSDASALDLLKQVVPDLNETECTDGIKVLDKIHMLSDLCAVPMLPLVLGSLFTVLVLLTIILVSIRCKPQIRQLLFRLNCGHRFIVSVNDDDDAKKVDVFLSYAHPDLHYLKQLKNGLESRGYSTLEHNRDWQPGDAIVTQITSSVKSARRTLLLVSDHYAASKWAVKEFHTAHWHALKRQTARVLVVLYDLRHPEKLPPDLQMYIKYNTYLDWQDASFWTKLCDAMPLRLNISNQ